MYCTFYRPATANTIEFENIIGKLAYDLHLLETKNQDEWSVYTYFYSLCRNAQPLAKNQKMRFLGLAAPELMPADARVEYFYKPTYIATAFMMKATLLFPSLMNEDAFLDSELDFTVDTVKKTLTSCMRACTGRGFDGAGILWLKDCIEIFSNAGADEFLDKYPDLCPEFTNLYREKICYLSKRNDNAHDDLYQYSR